MRFIRNRDGGLGLEGLSEAVTLIYVVAVAVFGGGAFFFWEKSPTLGYTFAGVTVGLLILGGGLYAYLRGWV